MAGSVSTEDKVLEGENQCLQAQNQRVHERECIHDVESRSSKCTGFFVGDDVVVIGISIGNAAAAKIGRAHV